MHRWLTRLAKPLLALFATLLALGVCEIILRLVGSTPEVIPIGITSDESIYRRSKNPYLSYEFKPNYRNDAADLKFDHPRTNAHGLRDVEREWEKPPGTQRIILLGDSVVVGFGVREIDDLMSRQLEAMYPDRAVEVLNLAVSGYCTRAEIELLKVKGLAYDPDLVILVFVENDFYNFNREARYTDGIAGRPQIVRALYRTSHLFRTTCLRFNLFGFGMETDPAHWNQLAIGDNNVAEGFQLLRDMAVEHGFEVLVTIWPAFKNTEIVYNDMMFMPQSRELIADRLARVHGLTPVRLDGPFRKHWQSLSPRPNPRIFYTVGGDEMHPTVEGHRVAATILKQIIDAKDLLNPTSSLRTIHEPLSDDPAAVAAAKSLGTEKSDYSAVHYNRGKELMREGKTEEAIKEFEETIRLNPNYAADAHNDIGFILSERGQTDAAIAHYREALRMNPTNHLVHVSMGNALRKQEKLDEAIGYYRQAARLRPEDFAAQYSLGTTLFRQRKYAEAVPHLEIAARVRPTDARAAKRLGDAYLQLGKRDDAVAQLQRAISLSGNRAADYNQVGLTLARAGRADEAAQTFRRGLTVEPDHAELHFNLGKLLSASGDLAGALEHLQRARDLAPSNINAHNSLGVVYAKMGRIAEASEAFSRALEIDPNDTMARRNLRQARSMQQRGRGP